MVAGIQRIWVLLPRPGCTSRAASVFSVPGVRQCSPNRREADMANDGRALAGRVAWVTGSSRGLGRVIAAHLARLGAAVAVHGTTPTSTRAFDEAESLDYVARALAEESASPTMAVFGNLTDEQAVHSIALQIRAQFGRIDILVNNAGGDIGAAG